MQKQRKKGKGGRVISRLIATPVGALAGYWLAYLALYLFRGISENLTPWSKSLILACSAIFFAAIFCLSAPAFAGWILNIGYAVERKLAKFSPRDTAGGMIGLVGGLLLAFLLSQLIAYIPIYPLSVTLTILVYVLFAVSGAAFGAKKLAGIIVMKDKADEAVPVYLKVLDSSAIIDGRIFDLAKTGFLDGTFVVPSFILDELRTIADSADDLKRNRGRRGLDIVAAMQNTEGLKVIISDDPVENAPDTDAKLLKLAGKLGAKVLTTDYNLGKVAAVMNIRVLNINELANAIKPVVLPGERMEIDIIKPGKDPIQGVGFLADGTMVVVENGGGNIGKHVTVTVRTSLQTAAGRMIFTRLPEKM